MKEEESRFTNLEALQALSRVNFITIPTNGIINCNFGFFTQKDTS